MPGDPVAEWLRFGLERNGRVRVIGFRESHKITIELDRVFVPLWVYADRARRGAEPGAPDDRDGLDHGTRITLDEALAFAAEGRTMLALIGYPGSGKTTLLRHLFRRVALGEVEGRTAHLRGLHPVYVRLADITDDELIGPGSERSLARVLARMAAADTYPEAGAQLLGRRDPALLFLLDGLDEVRDHDTRKRLCAWLNREVDHWPGCGFVVTSRPGAWADTPDLAERFRPVSIQGLGRDAIGDYVHRWFAAVERHFRGAQEADAAVDDRARARADQLLAVLNGSTWRSTARLLEMTANPLMLSTLCLAHYSDTRLPEQRGALYDRSIGLLIEAWTRERAGGPELDNEAVRLVLQPLAYGMQARHRRELPVGETVELVRAPLAQVPSLRTSAPTAERFVQLVRDECGILASRQLGTIEFVHLSFQEYLAACHIAERGMGRELAEHAGDTRWEEVILLAMSRPGVFAPFMARALEREVDDSLLRRCLADAVRIDPAPFETAADRALARLRAPAGWLARFVRWLTGRPVPTPAADELRRLFELVSGYAVPGMVERARTVVDSEDRALRAVARRLAGLEETADTAVRKGQPFVEPVTGMEFVWVPSGSFVMGSSKEPGGPNYDPDALDREVPAHPVQLTGFWIGVYPVTNEQYARFVAETGRAAPESFADRRLNDPAKPVVTVSWEAARAFTAWLTSKLAGVVARLPTEAEWEYAARGTDGRRYPWGNEPPNASRATYGSMQPAVVGHTPGGVSSFGVHDLAGNVWEWCLDNWADSYAEIKAGPIDPCHHGDTRGQSRVVRGGPWNVGARGLRSASRNRRHPPDQKLILGFRVVCGGAHQPDAH